MKMNTCTRWKSQKNATAANENFFIAYICHENEHLYSLEVAKKRRLCTELFLYHK